MTQADLQITYRRGKPFAAYLTIGGRSNRKVAASRECGPIVVDFDADENVLGFEIHTITPAAIERLKRELIALNLTDVSERELQPLIAA